MKVALIIISSEIKYVCGYKKAIENILQYIELAGATASTSDIASLGGHEIPDGKRRINEKSQEDQIVSDNDFHADKQKYFTALKM